MRPRSRSNWLRSLAWAAAICAVATRPAAGQEESWELTPCRVQILLAIEAPGRLCQQLSESLPGFVLERVDAAIGPAWSVGIEIATGATRHEILNHIDSVADNPDAGQLLPGGDKLLLIAVRDMPYGYELSAREYDRYVKAWGQPIRRECRQLSALPDQLFALVWQGVATLVQLELDPRDENHVVLNPRGGKLPRKSEDAKFAAPGDLFLPFLRRINHEGEVVEDGIQLVPWTYIEATESNDDGLVGRIYSGTRRPFGVRRRGRIEQVAIALRADPQPVTIRLQSRTRPDKPLVGYEVHAQNAGEDSLTFLGTTNRLGQIVVPPSEKQVQLLYVKHGGAVMARLPIVPGDVGPFDVPLPDDDIRLQAEQRLTAMREELVDVVARRNILISRTKQKISSEQYNQADELLTALDQLPGRSQFSQLLARESRLHRSDDPQVQQRIDRLIADTEEILGRYLDVQTISDLHDELRQARDGS